MEKRLIGFDELAEDCHWKDGGACNHAQGDGGCLTDRTIDGYHMMVCPRWSQLEIPGIVRCVGCINLFRYGELKEGHCHECIYGEKEK